jgi:hypothetical protein
MAEKGTMTPVVMFGSKREKNIMGPMSGRKVPKLSNPKCIYSAHAYIYV